MRGLLQSQRTYTLGIILGLIIILSPLVLLKTYASDFSDTYTLECRHDNMTISTNTLYYFCNNFSNTPTGSNVLYEMLIPVTSTLNFIAFNDSAFLGGNSSTSLYLFSRFIDGSTSSILLGIVNPNNNSRNYNFTVNQDYSNGDKVQFKINGGSSTITNDSQTGILFFTTTSSIAIMSTTTDTIVGNVFNQIYLLGWFFFFFVIVWIVFKITKR